MARTLIVSDRRHGKNKPARRTMAARVGGGNGHVQKCSPVYEFSHSACAQTSGATSGGGHARSGGFERRGSDAVAGAGLSQ